MNSELFTIPFINVPIQGYGLMVLLGVISALTLIRRGARARGWDAEGPTDIAVWSIICGVAGGRVYYVIDNFEQVGWADSYKIWQGGLVLYGALIGGLISCLLLLRAKGLKPLSFLDLVSPSLAIGIAFGRVGCLLHGCCHGEVCIEGYPLAITFPPGAPASFLHHGSAELASLPVHPSQIYSTVHGLLLCALLWRISKYRLPAGSLLGAFLLCYGMGRFLIEGVRGENHALGAGFSLAQMISFGFMASGLLILLRAKLWGKSEPYATLTVNSAA